MSRQRPRRYLWLGIGAVVVALVIGAGTWWALAGSLYEKVGPGYMTVLGPGGPLVVYEKPGQPAAGLLWREMLTVPLEVTLISPDYVHHDGTLGQMSFRVVEDEQGHRWLAPVQGSNPPMPSPDHSFYFLEDEDQLYLINVGTLEMTPLLPWTYQGKSLPELVEERDAPVFWGGWPLWTPDGRSVIFLTDRSGQFDLRRVDIATGAETIVTSCEGKTWALHGWTDDGRLLVQDCLGGDSPDAFFLLNLESGARENLGLQPYNSRINGPYIIAHQSAALTSPYLLYDVNRRATAFLPAAPAGYSYRMPFLPSPDGTGIALWLRTNGGDSIVGIIDLTDDPLSLSTYPPPARVTAELMWLDDETIVIRSGTINDPERATYALKVGGRK